MAFAGEGSMPASRRYSRLPLVLLYVVGSGWWGCGGVEGGGEDAVGVPDFGWFGGAGFEVFEQGGLYADFGAGVSSLLACGMVLFPVCGWFVLSQRFGT